MKIPRAKLYIDFFTLIKSFIKILFNVGLKRGPKVKKLENLFENYWVEKIVSPHQLVDYLCIMYWNL